MLELTGWLADRSLARSPPPPPRQLTLTLTLTTACLLLPRDGLEPQSAVQKPPYPCCRHRQTAEGRPPLFPPPPPMDNTSSQCGPMAAAAPGPPLSRPSFQSLAPAQLQCAGAAALLGHWEPELAARSNGLESHGSGDWGQKKERGRPAGRMTGLTVNKRRPTD